MYLIYDYDAAGNLRWYVKKGRKVRIKEKYGTAAFDEAYEAAIEELGASRMRRVRPDAKPDDPRKYLRLDRSRHGQLRYYVQLKDRLPKIRIRAAYGSAEFDRLVAKAAASQTALYGLAPELLEQPKAARPEPVLLSALPPEAGTLRWYWTAYLQSDHWLGGNAVKGLSPKTRQQRTLLVEPLLYKNGEKPFGVMTRQFVKEELKKRTPSNAGNLLSALRGLTAWMKSHEAGEPYFLSEDDDPTIGQKTRKKIASKESGGFKPYTAAQIAKFRARWPIGTEAYLMLVILQDCGFRLGDAYRFGPPHVRYETGLTLVDDTGTGLVTEIETEKSGFQTTVNMPLSAELFEAINATETGEEVFVGKRERDKIVAMSKEGWGMKFKKYMLLAGINVPGQRCHGMRKTSAIESAYAGATTIELKRMYGWENSQMPDLYTAMANGEKLARSGAGKRAAYREQMKNKRQNGPGTNTPLLGSKWKKMQDNQ
jgi:integrase